MLIPSLAYQAGRQQKEPNYKLIAKETNYQEQKINLLIEPETTAHELPWNKVN